MVGGTHHRWDKAGRAHSDKQRNHQQMHITWTFYQIFFMLVFSTNVFWQWTLFFKIATKIYMLKQYTELGVTVILGNMEVYSFCHFSTLRLVHEIEILPPGRLRTQWLLMTWLFLSPGHPQPWFQSSCPEIFLLRHQKAELIEAVTYICR